MSRRSAHPLLCVPAVLLAMLAMACGPEIPAADPDATALFRASGRHLLNAGAAPDSADRVVIGVLLAARFVGDGRSVAVLDAVAPHVKVYGADGRLRAAFLERGGGPRESRFPSALAALGDSALMVSDVSGRVAVFRLDGKLLWETRVSSLAVLAAVDACGDGWVFYGPRAHPSGRVGWLHHVTMAGDDSAAVVEVYADSLRTPLLPVGIPYGVVSAGDRVVARHGFGAHSRLVRWACGAGASRSAALSGVATVPDRAPEAVGKGISAFVSRSDEPVVGGLAETAAGLLAGDVRWAGERDAFTELTLLGGTPTRVVVAGIYHLRDSRPGAGILVSTNEPTPHVFVLPESEVLSLFRPRP